MILNILKRETLLNYKPIQINENMVNTKSKYSMYILMNNWKSLDSVEEFALKNTLNIISESISYANESDKRSILYHFNNVVIPSIKNIKESKKYIIKFCKDNDLHNYGILENYDDYIKSNRIINNHNILNNKFKFDNYINEFKINEYNIDECVYELCNMIDKSTSNLDVKRTVASENIKYGLSKSGYVENVDFYIDNFFSKKYNTNISINEDTKKHILDITIKIPSVMKSLLYKIYTKSPNQIINELPNLFSWIRSFLAFSTIALNPIFGILVFCTDKFIEMKFKRSETEKFIKKYKSERDKIEKKYNNSKNEKIKDNYKKYLDELNKNIKKLEDYEDNLYSEKERDERMFGDDDMLFDENAHPLNEGDEKIYKNIDQIIKNQRKSVSLEDYFKIDHTLVVSQLDIAIKTLINLLQTSYKTLSNSEVIVPVSENQIQYFVNAKENNIIKYLDVDGKLNIEIGNLLPLNLRTEENLNKEISNILSDICSRIDDVLGDRFYTTYDGFDDLYRIYLIYDLGIDVDYVEQFHKDTLDDIKSILTIESYVSNIYENYDIIKNIDTNIMKLENAIPDLTNFALHYPQILNPSELEDVLKEHQNNILKETDNSKYRKVMYLSEGIFNLQQNNNISKNINKGRYSIIYELININNILESIQSLNETSFGNTLKLARERLSSSVKNLDSKQKTMSKQLDNNVSKFQEKIDMAISSQNRESVIKGTLIPSASRTIKTALLIGATWAIAPAITVIGALGALAMSKKLKKKEKQLILDEIDIELKVVEKKIQLAERNDDMKALEKLLKIEKRLKREKQRIEYNLKVYYSTDFKSNDD